MPLSVPASGTDVSGTAPTSGSDASSGADVVADGRADGRADGAPLAEADSPASLLAALAEGASPASGRWDLPESFSGSEARTSN